MLLQIRFWVSKVAATPSTSDGLTVQKVLASNWNILDENDDDWKSHFAAVAQSINLIKRNLRDLIVRVWYGERKDRDKEDHVLEAGVMIFSGTRKLYDFTESNYL
ncbi:hypothetical protein ACSQ67_025106 [Phaseolus vulgaris]